MLVKYRNKKKVSSWYFKYLLLIPFLLLGLLFIIIPFFLTIFLSLYSFDKGSYHLIYFDNYQRLIQDELFWGSMLHTIELLVKYVIIKVPLLLVAVYLYQHLRYKLKIYVILSLLPTIMGGYAYAIVFRFLFTKNGLINNVLYNVLDFRIDWYNQAFFAQLVLVIGLIWGSFGLSFIMLNTSYDTISKELHESIRIDGANAYQHMIYLIIPSLRKMLITILIFSTIEVFSLVDVPLNLFDGGPKGSTTTVGLYLFKQGIRYGDITYASSISTVFMTMIVTVFLLLQFGGKRYGKK